MMISRALGLVGTFLCLVATACSSSSSGTNNGDAGKNTTDGGPSTSNTGSCKVYRACDLLSTADINTALNSSLLPSAAIEQDNQSTPANPGDEVIGCNVGGNDATEPTLVLTVTCSTEDENTPSNLAFFLNRCTGSCVTISDLGVAATFKPSLNAAGALDSGSLTVWVGTGVFIDFSFSYPIEPTSVVTPAQGQAAAVSMARDIIAKL